MNWFVGAARAFARQIHDSVGALFTLVERRRSAGRGLALEQVATDVTAARIGGNPLPSRGSSRSSRSRCSTR
jgi:hypothetical protein